MENSMLVNEIKCNFKNDPIISRNAIDKNGNLTLYIAWKLNNDNERPNKESRCIVMTLTEEAIDAFEKKHNEDMKRKVKKYIEERMKTFNPDHDTPYGEPIPCENFGTISTVELGLK